ncbi:MAG: hypothetical protein IKU17_10730 [Clostridia bacterium]|nr:hypothetical protein [Clostridia bacterium]
MMTAAASSAAGKSLKNNLFALKQSKSCTGSTMRTAAAVAAMIHVSRNHKSIILFHLLTFYLSNPAKSYVRKQAQRMVCRACFLNNHFISGSSTGRIPSAMAMKPDFHFFCQKEILRRKAKKSLFHQRLQYRANAQRHGHEARLPFLLPKRNSPPEGEKIFISATAPVPGECPVPWP